SLPTITGRIWTWLPWTTCTVMPLAPKTSELVGTIADGCSRRTWNRTLPYIPGSNVWVWLGTSTSTRRVRVDVSMAPAVRPTVPGKLREGRLGTIRSAGCPTRTSVAYPCGTYTCTRRTSTCSMVNSDLLMSVCPDAMSAPASYPREVMTPENGATTVWNC